MDVRDEEEKELCDMLLRYVYFKTPWYADMHTTFYVDISDSLLNQIENDSMSPKIQFDILCLQLWLLSDGQLIIGQNTDFMRQREIEYNRLRRSRSHAFTWIGYERVDKDIGMISAMVPRRIPQTKTVEIKCKDGQSLKQQKLEKFRLEHYAMMLSTFELPLDETLLEVQINGSCDYEKFLPVDRLEPFKWSKYKIVSSSDQEYRAIKAANYSTFFRNDNTGCILSRDVIRNYNKEHCLNKVYQVECLFRSNFDQVSFLFEDILYEQDADGNWKLNPELATEENFQKFKTEQMPDEYVAQVR